MRKWKTSSGMVIFQVLGGRSNSYLIHSEKGNILVDTGKSAAFDKLVESLQQLRMQAKDVDYLVLTHTHFDHCQNAGVFHNSSNCKLIVGKPEAFFAEGGYTPLPQGVFPVTRIISWIGNRIGKSVFGYKPFLPDISIEDETVLESLPVKILPTPGHTIGSVSLIIDNEIALVGDTLFGVFRNSVLPPFADDLSRTIKSWGTLLASGCHTFLPGHGGEIKREVLQREFLKYSEKE